MERKFDVIKPNLYVVNEGELYFSVSPSETLSASRVVDEVVREHISPLKIRKLDLEVIREGKAKKDLRGTELFDITLSNYIVELMKREEEGRVLRDISTDFAKMIDSDLGYLIISQTIEDAEEIRRWHYCQEFLKDKEKSLEEARKDVLRRSFILDEAKTLEEMKKTYKKLDAQIPTVHISFDLIEGSFPVQSKVEVFGLGYVGFAELKEGGKEKIRTVRNNLVTKLKEFDGPCLSFDAPEISDQALRLTNNSYRLIQAYGDILTNPNWRRRLFKLDP